MARAGWNQCGLPGTAPPAPICHLKTSEADRTDSRRGGAALLVRSGGRDTQAPSLHPPCTRPRPASQACTRPAPAPHPRAPGAAGLSAAWERKPQASVSACETDDTPKLFLEKSGAGFLCPSSARQGKFPFPGWKGVAERVGSGLRVLPQSLPRLRFSHLQNKQDDLGPVGLKETLHLNDLAKGLVPDKEPRGREWGWRWQR